MAKSDMAKPSNEGSMCDGNCGVCKMCSWLMPLIIVILTWWYPAATWSKVVITIAAVALFAKKCCPCNKPA